MAVWLAWVALAAAGAGCAVEPADPTADPAGAHAFDRRILLMLPSPRTWYLGPWEEIGSQYTSRRERDRALKAASALAGQYGLRVVDDWPMPDLKLYCVVAEVAAGQEPAQVLARLNADKRLAWAQPVEQFHTLEQTGAVGGIESRSRWRDLEALHSVATGRGVTIAEIDSGVDVRHPDLAAQSSAAQDFVGDGVHAELHGTAVAGVMVARSDPVVGLVGVAPGAHLLPLRACWASGEQGALCSSFTLAKAFQYALSHQVGVINLSLTGPHDLLLERLIDRAVARGVVVVAAAQDGAADPGFPASQAQVIAVASRGSPAPMRHLLLAPGEDILTTTPRGTWGFLSGSSFAAAHVSGLVALLLEVSPRSTPGKVTALLQKTASAQPGGPSFAFVHPCAALRAFAPERSALRCAEAQSVDVTPPSRATMR